VSDLKSKKSSANSAISSAVRRVGFIRYLPYDRYKKKYKEKKKTQEEEAAQRLGSCSTSDKTDCSSINSSIFSSFILYHIEKQDTGFSMQVQLSQAFPKFKAKNRNFIISAGFKEESAEYKEGRKTAEKAGGPLLSQAQG